MRIKCLIIDDEPLAINVIKNHLEHVSDIDIANTFSNGLDALNYLNEHEVDLIFLDINMPMLDGLNYIKSLDKKPMIIITSAYEEFAAETYELDVLDYLVKPISLPRFLKATAKVFRKTHEMTPSDVQHIDRPYLFIKIDKKKNLAQKEEHY